MASPAPLLVVTLEGGGVRDGRLPVTDFALLVGGVQQCVLRLGQALSGGGSTTPDGPVEAAASGCALGVVGLSADGTEVAFDLVASEEGQASQLGRRAIGAMVEGLALLSGDAPRLHEAFDYAVLASLRGLGRLLDRGAERVRVRVLSGEGPGREAALDVPVRDRLHSYALGPSRQGIRVKGWVREVDLDRRSCRVQPPEGPQVTCALAERHVPAAGDALGRYVVATGVATERSPDGRILVLETGDIEVVDEEPWPETGRLPR